MVVPVVIAMAQAAAAGGVPGREFRIHAPRVNPPNAIVYGSGLVPLPKMMRAGILLDLAGFFLIWGGLYVLNPVLGLL